MVNFLGDDEIGKVAYFETEEHIEDVPVKRDPFDVYPLLDLFRQYHGEIATMHKKAAELAVVNDGSLSLATTYTTQAKALAQAIEKKRVELKAPYLEIVRVLDGETKTLKDHLQSVQDEINQKIRPYLQQKEVERREAERKAQEEAARVQAELEQKVALRKDQAAEAARAAAEAAGMDKQAAEAQAQAAAAMVEEAPVVVPVMPPPETSVKTDTGTAKLKEEWTFEILNIKSLPDEAYESRRDEIIKALAPWINAQMKAGVRVIPGCRIFKQAKLETRTSKKGFVF